MEESMATKGRLTITECLTTLMKFTWCFSTRKMGDDLDNGWMEEKRWEKHVEIVVEGEGAQVREASRKNGLGLACWSCF